MSLIRTHTFLKYARIHLQEAEAALAEDRPERCAAKVFDAHAALIKAVAAALPMVKGDFFKMDERQLSRHISDLSDEAETARQITSLLFKVKASQDSGQPQEDHAGPLLSWAGQAFSLLHDLFIR